MATEQQILDKVTTADYAYGFESGIAVDAIPKGISESTIHLISEKKKEPQWMLNRRLKAYHHWCKLTPPQWAKISYPPINYEDIIYYAAPQQKASKS